MKLLFIVLMAILSICGHKKPEPVDNSESTQPPWKKIVDMIEKGGDLDPTQFNKNDLEELLKQMNLTSNLQMPT